MNGFPSFQGTVRIPELIWQEIEEIAKERNVRPVEIFREVIATGLMLYKEKYYVKSDDGSFRRLVSSFPKQE